jgi:hypothetical protein
MGGRRPLLFKDGSSTASGSLSASESPEMLFKMDGKLLS